MEVKPYRAEDLENILENFVMRKMDQEEVTAQSGLEPLEVIKQALEMSESAWVAYDGSTPIGIGGFVLREGYGVPWMIRSAQAFNSRLFEAHSYILGALDIFMSKTSYLTNFVAKDNKDTIRWLRFLGFTVTDDEYILVDPDMIFYHFYMLKKGV